MITRYGQTVEHDSLTGQLKIIGAKTDLDLRNTISINEDHAHLMLSGGCDSQALSQWLIHLGIPQTCYTYIALWDDEVINSTDVVQAQRYAAKHGIKHELLELDLKEFFESGQHIAVAKKYNCKSPQVAFQLYAFEKFNTPNIFTGGEAPTFIQGTEENTLHGIGVNYGILLQYHQVYLRWAKSCNKRIYRNLFWDTPETLWASSYVNLSLLNDGYYCHPHQTKRETLTYKNMFYKRCGFDVLELHTKQTGFENLKKLLAAQSGYYDEFNFRYRQPLTLMGIGKIPPEEVRVSRVIISPDLQLLYDEYKELLPVKKLTNMVQYQFDL